jgi:hypothetical protein
MWVFDSEMSVVWYIIWRPISVLRSQFSTLCGNVSTVDVIVLPLTGGFFWILIFDIELWGFCSVVIGLFCCSWWQHAANLASYEQQDAHEFFISMLDGIHEKVEKDRHKTHGLGKEILSFCRFSCWISHACDFSLRFWSHNLEDMKHQMCFAVCWQMGNALVEGFNCILFNQKLQNLVFSTDLIIEVGCLFAVWLNVGP